MATITDAQLLLLEQLSYINESVMEKAGIPFSRGVESLDTGGTVGDLIRRFLENGEQGLNKLRSIGENDVTAQMNGNEIAAVIKAISQYPELMNLELKNKDTQYGVYFFKDADGKGFLVFRGTTTGDEWYDNFTGLGTADTKLQREALDFVNDLDADDITVVGHSKGGNKAMYCAILSDKVSRAISIDGQGFSNEFLQKYEEEIKRNAGKITNYSLDTDYVHILLNQPEGSTQVYLDGNDYVNFGKSHCPASLFRFEERDGIWDIAMEDGYPEIHPTRENSSMTYLHDFTAFVLDVCPIEDRQKMGDYLGQIMACSRRPYPEPGYYQFVDADGISYTSENIMEFVFKHPETLGLVLAYVMKFGELHNMTEEQMLDLLRFFGLNDVVTAFTKAIADFSLKNPAAVPARFLGKSILSILKMIVANLTDGNHDPLIESFLSVFGAFLSEQLGIPLNLDRLWQTIEAEYTAIGNVDASTNTVNTLETTSKTFDYSSRVYHQLMSVMNRIDSLTSGSVSSWNGVYGGEPWYDDLGINLFVEGINGYSSRLAQINQYCRNEINTIFLNVQRIDTEKGNQLVRQQEMADSIKGKLLALS